MTLHEKFLEWHFRQYPPEHHNFNYDQYPKGKYVDWRVHNRWGAFKAGYEAMKQEENEAREKRTMNKLDTAMHEDPWWRGFKLGVIVGMVVGFILVGISG